MHLMMCLHHLRQISLANPTKVHLEGQLTDDDMRFTGQHLADFMAKVGSFKRIYIYLNIRKMIISVFFRRTSLHVKLDKYLEFSNKSVESIRRAGGVECVDLNEISAEIQIPKKLEKCWTSPA